MPFSTGLSCRCRTIQHSIVRSLVQSDLDTTQIALTTRAYLSSRGEICRVIEIEGRASGNFEGGRMPGNYNRHRGGHRCTSRASSTYSFHTSSHGASNNYYSGFFFLSQEKFEYLGSFPREDTPVGAYSMCFALNFNASSCTLIRRCIWYCKM